ncbi:endoglucanase family 5 glycoside hydrolase [Diplogelasinospora grovesii]|uniref:Endoglucanase family 5 glycoside hydrolase n=1 Tax=Diplogelasinospora grovesii TaxID=303347 RepID=A0AAN6MXF9_9PEZI|nr:endoglucanase family 5 glycoside hydrolase [Diplogelasinospora grovesii]
MNMSAGILRIDGDKVVDGNGKTVILRGAGLGGWMNMENFITGYPGHEHQHRAAMLKVLGQEKYDFFFDKFLEYFFRDADAKFYASLGLNCIRLPLNYRHFEDDMNPKVLKTSGFKHLDRVIDICAKNNIYTILDLHALPGGQNPDWHSDSGSNWSAFWDYKDFQDRTVWLWEELAKHYKGNAWVAGYNLINEPCDPEHVRLPKFYDRLEAAIRDIDPDHILWLDGNTFAIEWKGFERVLPNTAYSLHDYSLMGFPTGEPFKGTPEQKEKLERQFLRKAEFQRERGAAIWNGEFGPVYEDPAINPDADKTNEERYALLGAQLSIYDKYQIPWSIWLYKDIGFQGMVYCDPKSKYMQTVGQFVAKKRKLNLDAWGRYKNEELDKVLGPLVQWIDRNAPEATKTYPTTWDTERHVHRMVIEAFMASSFSMEFAKLFEGMGHEELEACAKSFAFENCLQRQGLNKIMSDHSKARS